MANNISRYDPFGNMSRLAPLRLFEDWFQDMPPLALRDVASESTIGLDIVESDQSYTVRAEIPGVKKEDIKVEVHGDRVSITAESHRETEQKQGERLVRRELFYGQQHRTFTLDHDVDGAKASAKYSDGVLELTLPKKTSGGASKLKIN